MLDKLKEEIKKEFIKENIYPSDLRIDTQIMSLFVLKYMCDTKEASYEEVIKNKLIEKFTYKIDSYEFKSSNVKSSFLYLIQYEDLKDLILEYLDNNKVGISIMNIHEKKLCITTRFKKEVYDVWGNTTYVLNDSNIREIFRFKFFDKVFNNNNKYLYKKDINFSDYNYLYMYDCSPVYRFVNKDNLNIIGITLDFVNNTDIENIVLHTDFRKIANIRHARYELKYFDKIVLFDDNNSFIYFKKKTSKNISIINYNKEKVSSLDKLRQIIDVNRQKKDVLIKITEDDIKNNYYRIGFNLYQTELKEDVKTINEIVDENTKLVEKLSSINITIEQEINNLINK